MGKKNETQGKYTYLIKNMGLLTLSNFATKLLSFFLVPLYTNVLTTAEYGTYDLLYTTINLLIPVLTLDIQEGVLRFAMDKDADHDNIFKIGLKYVVLSALVVLMFIAVNNVFGFSSSLKEYAAEFLLLYCINAFSAFLTYYIRGTSKVKELSISSVISSAIIIFSNIAFLVVFKWGLKGYFYAYILGGLAQSVYLVIKGNCVQAFKSKSSDVNLEKKVLEYSKPMIANAISWWVNNASDRYIVTWICGVAVNGIYSISYKIPTILNVLQSIFGQAWTLSAVKDFDREDKNNFFINVYDLFNFFLVCACSFLILTDKIVAKLLFASDFYVAWKYAPFLLISTVFSGLSAFIGGLLSAMKMSSTFAKTSVITAVVNTILNIVLVYFVGAQGAAISTAVAYFMMWIFRLYEIKKVMRLKVNIYRDVFVYCLLVIQAFLVICDKSDSLLNFSAAALMILIVFINYKCLMRLCIKGRSYIKNLKHKI